MPSVKSITLSNGLRVIHIPHSVGSITACLRGLAGSNYEKPDEVGAAHVLEHLCTYATKTYNTPNKLRNVILSGGGRVTGTTSRDDVAFFAKVLNKDLLNAVEYLFEVFHQPLLDQDNLEDTKNIIRHEIYQNIEDPKRHIGRISYRILYPNQRLSTYNTGDIEDIDRLKLSRIRAFKKKYYFPANFVLSVCGDFPSQKLFDLAKESFGSIEPANKNTALILKPNYKPDFLLENREDLPHMHLKIDYHGYKTEQHQKYPAYLLSILLKNRLRHALLEQKRSRASLPYLLDCSSFSTNSYGLFGLYTAIDPKFLESFLLIYQNITRNILQNPIPRNELEFCKNKAQADLEFALEKTSLRADYYSELFLYKNTAVNHQEELENYRNCTCKDIRETAKDLFRQNPKVTIIDRDLEKTKLKSIYNKVFLS